MTISFPRVGRAGVMLTLASMLSWMALTGALHAATTSITIAAEDDWPPYSFRKAGTDDIEGFTPDLVREAFKLKGVDVTYLVVPYSRCMSMVKTGKVLACFNTNRNEEIRPDYHWHETPLFIEGVSYFTLSDFQGESLQAEALEGSTVGVTTGYAYSPKFMRNEKIKKFEANSDDHLLKMLIAKRIDFALINTLPGQLRINSDPAYAGKIKPVGVLSVHGFFVNFSKAHPDGKAMAELLEAGLQELKASGRYDEMYAEFRERIGVPP